MHGQLFRRRPSGCFTITYVKWELNIRLYLPPTKLGQMFRHQCNLVLLLLKCSNPLEITCSDCNIKKSSTTSRWWPNHPITYSWNINIITPRQLMKKEILAYGVLGTHVVTSIPRWVIHSIHTESVIRYSTYSVEIQETLAFFNSKLWNPQTK